MRKKLILITNDDGIDSPGLMAAAEGVLGLADLLLVAPARQYTSMGRSLRGARTERLLNRDYKVNGVDLEAYSMDCSPARLVLHTLDVLCADRKPDLIVSGVNYGENLGTNVTISATIGAAIEAASAGVPGLAVSLETAIENHHIHAELDWTVARHFTHKFAEMMLNKKLPHDVDILNVNVPSSATTDTAWRVTRQSRQPHFINIVRDPSVEKTIGDGECVIGYDKDMLEPDSDIRAVSIDRLVSVTPLSIDLTSRTDLNKLVL